MKLLPNQLYQISKPSEILKMKFLFFFGFIQKKKKPNKPLFVEAVYYSTVGWYLLDSSPKLIKIQPNKNEL